MWAIIDMEFNSFTKYDEIRDLYLKLNQGYNTRGGLKYFYQPFTGGLPKPVVNKFAQNEFRFARADCNCGFSPFGTNS
jgi:hypothetical protein